MAQNGQGMDPAVLDDIINRLLEFRQARSVRQVQVQLSEAEIRQLCTVSREIFLQQPNLLELKAPIKICGGAKNNAPIFVYTGNEGEIEWFAQNTGFMFEIAPSFRALLIFIEHRFYGQSMPFGGDKNIAYQNSSTLGYLSSTQALADYATLIIDLKKNLSATDSPVVVFGGSYGGMLAAWFRLKYPHVTIGALSSSLPILV